MNVCRAISRRTIPPTEDQTLFTLYWFNLFHEFFLASPDTDDDLLYFVRDEAPSLQVPVQPLNKEATPPQEGVFVQRKPVGSSDVPKLEGLVRWEETFYVNLIARLDYVVRVCICRDGKRVSCWQGRVFAEPLRHEHGKEKVDCVFPAIHFTVHELEKTVSLRTGEILCIELKAIENLSHYEADPSANDPSDQPPYMAWVGDDNSVVLFQGAVSYESLLSVKKKKGRGLSLKSSQKVVMKGPGGRGIAQMRISEHPREGPGDNDGALNLLKRGIEKIRENEASTPMLFCHLSHISLPWRVIIVDVMQHADS